MTGDQSLRAALDELRNRMRAAVRVARTLPHVAVEWPGTFVGPLT